DELGNRMAAIAQAAPKGRELRAAIEAYLSPKHLTAPGAGCPLAALAPEIARQSPEVRKRINQSMLAYRDRMLPYISGRTVEQKRARVFILFSGMAGTLAAARAITDAKERERILAAARSFYTETFASAE